MDGIRSLFPSARRLAANFVTPAFSPKSVNKTRSEGTTRTKVYCPYNSGPRKRPIRIAETAKITLAKAAPENKKKPPRAESSVICDNSFASCLFPVQIMISSVCVAQKTLSGGSCVKPEVNIPILILKSV